MQALWGDFTAQSHGEPMVVRLTGDSSLPPQEQTSDGLLVENAHDLDGVRLDRYRAVLLKGGQAVGAIVVPECLHYLQAEDIVRIDPIAGRIRVLYRRHALHNHFLVTERCNSRCLMCSQPPRDIDDGYLVEELLQAIPLMSPLTNVIGFTGGEITLLGSRFTELLLAARTHLPVAHVFCLTNGRRLTYAKYAAEIAAVEHPDLLLCVPLYSDIDSIHDFVVQADGAFDETIRGILNLGRFGVPVEIRVVIHQQTYRRLPELAEFIARNLPFVSHVALMGLEHTGFTKSNFEALWIDPIAYQVELERSVTTFALSGIPVSIYNHQLCVLPQSLWQYARRSISDWKNAYLAQCEKCAMRESCGGFFASNLLRYSSGIRPLEHNKMPPN